MYKLQSKKDKKKEKKCVSDWEREKDEIGLS